MPPIEVAPTTDHCRRAGTEHTTRRTQTVRASLPGYRDRSNRRSTRPQRSVNPRPPPTRAAVSPLPLRQDYAAAHSVDINAVCDNGSETPHTGPDAAGGARSRLRGAVALGGAMFGVAEKLTVKSPIAPCGAPFSDLGLGIGERTGGRWCRRGELSGGGPASGTSAPHVMVVMMENKEIHRRHRQVGSALHQQPGLALRAGDAELCRRPPVAAELPRRSCRGSRIRGGRPTTVDKPVEPTASPASRRSPASSHGAGIQRAGAYAEDLRGGTRRTNSGCSTRCRHRPLGILPGHCDADQQRVLDGVRPQQRQPTGLRLVHTQFDQRRARRDGAAGRLLPLLLHPGRPGDELVQVGRSDHRHVGRVQQRQQLPTAVGGSQPSW